MKDSIYLYKYRPDDIYTIKLLCEQRLHFSHPNDFNDPFDCKPLCAQNVSDDEILAQIDRSQPWLSQLIKDNIGVVHDMVKKGVIRDQINERLNLNYICCFSYNPDIPAMWAHYAQNHNGLCLGFDTSIKSPFLDGIKRKVKYVDKQSELNWTKIGVEDPDGQTPLFFFEKAKEWQYEEEYRVVKHHSMISIAPGGYNSFRKEALVAMFFGLRMSQERQNFYMDLCKLCGLNNIVFHKMTMPQDGSYHLMPKVIND